MAAKYAGMTYDQRIRIYEKEKAYLSQVCSTWQEYEKKIKELIKELGI